MQEEQHHGQGDDGVKIPPGLRVPDAGRADSCGDGKSCRPRPEVLAGEQPAAENQQQLFEEQQRVEDRQEIDELQEPRYDQHHRIKDAALDDVPPCARRPMREVWQPLGVFAVPDEVVEEVVLQIEVLKPVMTAGNCARRRQIDGPRKFHGSKKQDRAAASKQVRPGCLGRGGGLGRQREWYVSRKTWSM